MVEGTPRKNDPVRLLLAPSYWDGKSLGDIDPVNPGSKLPIRGAREAEKQLWNYLRHAQNHRFEPLQTYGPGSTFPLVLQDPGTIILYGIEQLTNYPSLREIYKEDRGDLRIDTFEGKAIPPEQISPHDKQILRFIDDKTYERRVLWGVVAKGKGGEGRVIFQASTDFVDSIDQTRPTEGALASLALAGPNDFEIKVGTVRGRRRSFPHSRYSFLERIVRINVYDWGLPEKERVLSPSALFGKTLTEPVSH